MTMLAPNQKYQMLIPSEVLMCSAETLRSRSSRGVRIAFARDRDVGAEEHKHVAAYV